MLIFAARPSNLITIRVLWVYRFFIKLEAGLAEAPQQADTLCWQASDMSASPFSLKRDARLYNSPDGVVSSCPIGTFANATRTTPHIQAVQTARNASHLPPRLFGFFSSDIGNALEPQEPFLLQCHQRSMQMPPRRHLQKPDQLLRHRSSSGRS